MARKRSGGSAVQASTRSSTLGRRASSGTGNSYLNRFLYSLAQGLPGFFECSQRVAVTSAWNDAKSREKAYAADKFNQTATAASASASPGCEIDSTVPNVPR